MRRKDRLRSGYARRLDWLLFNDTAIKEGENGAESWAAGRGKVAMREKGEGGKTGFAEAKSRRKRGLVTRGAQLGWGVRRGTLENTRISRSLNYPKRVR